MAALVFSGDCAIKNWNDRVRERMKELDLTQKDMAELLGITQGAISNYLNGTREPNMDVLANLIRELGVTADWVVLGIRNKSKAQNFNTVGVSQKFSQLSKADKFKVNNAIEILALNVDQEH
ncbi:helix-turn-helix transcriptional regulator [Halioxenophilus aromaticivorans]